MTDSQLTALIIAPATRRKGFELLVEAYGQRLYQQIRHIVFNHADADDILQNTFLKAWQKIDSFEQRSQLFTWLSRIAINEAVEHLRQRKKTAELQPAIAADTLRLTADSYFDADRAESLLLQAVEALPTQQRTVFTLRYFQEMKYSEMSRLLDISEGGLKANYHHAVRKIHEFVTAAG